MVTSFTYDYRNRLTEVTTGGAVVGTYVYDPLDRRTGTDANGAQTWTVYDGQNPYADFNGAGLPRNGATRHNGAQHTLSGRCTRGAHRQ